MKKFIYIILCLISTHLFANQVILNHAQDLISDSLEIKASQSLNSAYIRQLQSRIDSAGCTESQTTKGTPCPVLSAPTTLTFTITQEMRDLLVELDGASAAPEVGATETHSISLLRIQYNTTDNTTAFNKTLSVVFPKTTATSFSPTFVINWDNSSNMLSGVNTSEEENGESFNFSAVSLLQNANTAATSLTEGGIIQDGVNSSGVIATETYALIINEVAAPSTGGSSGVNILSLLNVTTPATHTITATDNTYKTIITADNNGGVIRAYDFTGNSTTEMIVNASGTRTALRTTFGTGSSLNWNAWRDGSGTTLTSTTSADALSARYPINTSAFDSTSYGVTTNSQVLSNIVTHFVIIADPTGVTTPGVLSSQFTNVIGVGYLFNIPGGRGLETHINYYGSSTLAKASSTGCAHGNDDQVKFFAAPSDLTSTTYTELPNLCLYSK